MTNIFSKFDPIKSLHGEIVSAAGIDPLAVRVGKFSSPTEAEINGKICIMMGSNNYLGLTFDSSAIEAARESLLNSGIGTTGSRVANGSYGPHQDLEQQIAKFFGRDNAILFTTGYQANVGFLSAIAGKDDYIIIDSESHASIYDGCRLGHATVLHFRHNDAEDLERRLARLPEAANKLVVTEGIFSMRGDRAPLKAIVTAAKKFGAYVMVDEAHSFGVLGEYGRGLAEECGVEDQVDFIIGTFSKSAGTIGGFCVSNHPELNTLRFAARAYLFTASLPPSVVIAVSKTLERIRTGQLLRQKLWNNSDQAYDGLKALGYEVGAEKTPIIGIMMPDMYEGLRTWRALMENGVYVNMVLPPAAPEGRCLLRCSVSAAHTSSQLDRVLKVFDQVRPRGRVEVRAAAE